MNITTDLPNINTIHGSVSEESLKFIGSEEEKNWIDRAIEDIKNPEKGIKLTERISSQVGKLSSFTPDQIFRLVILLDQWIKRVPDSQEATNYLYKEVAALIIKKDLHSFENFLQKSREKNFGLQVLIQLVRDRKLLPLIAVEHLQRYRIDPRSPAGQQALIEIAKLAAQQNAWETSENIKHYGIEDSTPEGQQALIEIAKLAAQQDGAITSCFIINYGIDASTLEGQQALIDIAKLAAQQDARVTSQYIKNYGIDASTPEGQQALIEIAKLAAQLNGEGTSSHIKEYGIDASTSEGRQALIEIAKLAAQQSVVGTSAFIKEYGFDASTPEGRQALIEIAKLAAQKDGGETSHYINRYGFDASTPKGRQALIEIAKLAAQQNGLVTFLYIKNYGIDAIQLGAALFEMDPAGLQWVQNILSKADKETIQTEFLDWWMSLACQCAGGEDLKRLFKENPSLFERISTLSPHLRTTLTQELIASSLETKGLFLDTLKEELFKKSSLVKKIAVLPRDLRVTVAQTFIRGYQGQYYEVWENLKKETADIAHARLACLILSQFPKGDYTAVLGKIKSDRSLRDAKHQQPLLEILRAIKNCALEDAAKIDLLNKMFAMSDKERQTGFRLMADILNFKGEAYLRERFDLPGLKSALEELFADKCKVQLDNFTLLYEKTVGTWRSKDALLTYASKHIANPAVLPYFQTFLTAVLKDNFQTIRYATDKNPHLAEIGQHHPKIFENWKLSAELKDDEVSIKNTGKTISGEQRVVETLKQAVENQHLGLERQEALFPILAACKGKWEPLDKPMELIAQQLSPLQNRRLSTEEIELKLRLLLQKAFLELIKDPSELEKKLNILKGIKIKGLAEALKPFYSDLEDAVKFMHSTTQPKVEGYKIIDTDDPNHFLLMGSEVLNSCQDVKGSASLNVGVLGYALDGKHRLALVCDPEGKILARSVLRLLVDDEGIPVIFQERVYVADANPAYPLLLRQMAVKKAGLLGVPLVVSPADFEKEQAEKYPLSIQAKAKPVPYEYVDARGGLQRGPYTIGNALHINPKRSIR